MFKQHKSNGAEIIESISAFVHTGLFFAWLVNNGLMSEFFIQETGNEIENLKTRKITPSTLYMDWDGVLLGEMLSDQGFNFAMNYFDFEKGTYMTDYENVFNDRPDRVLIAFNTLINNTQNIIQTPRKNGLGSTFITIAYNIIQGGGPAVEIEGPFANYSWSGNIVYGAADAGMIPETGLKKINPRVEEDSLCTFHLSTISPAVNVITKSYPSICCDIDGQPRVPPLDSGADEISDEQVISRVLFKSDVGQGAISFKISPPFGASEK